MQDNFFFLGISSGQKAERKHSQSRESVNNLPPVSFNADKHAFSAFLSFLFLEQNMLAVLIKLLLLLSTKNLFAI